ncbi:iron-binding protein [Candidatus Izimaplasma bacterium ZiA1]|uniref:CDGSH iron-sulfur domain-containing protein n=1 Tax=Candidatus Izimoplasma sp. ZiA1 TaxID=2024899 RepID=UPI000BAA75E7|nr:iron-binding protein [Candidatus Izimaplasma bacterium ZiA1]
MKKGEVYKKAPIGVELEAGKTYYWCACGKSSNQPFCDGSHKGTEFQPKAFEVKETSKQYLCQCKQTNNPPYCDGTHRNLE